MLLLVGSGFRCFLLFFRHTAGSQSRAWGTDDGLLTAKGAGCCLLPLLLLMCDDVVLLACECRKAHACCSICRIDACSTCTLPCCLVCFGPHAPVRLPQLQSPMQCHGSCMSHTPPNYSYSAIITKPIITCIAIPSTRGPWLCSNSSILYREWQTRSGLMAWIQSLTPITTNKRTIQGAGKKGATTYKNSKGPGRHGGRDHGSRAEHREHRESLPGTRPETGNQTSPQNPGACNPDRMTDCTTEAQPPPLLPAAVCGRAFAAWRDPADADFELRARHGQAGRSADGAAGVGAAPSTPSLPRTALYCTAP